MLPGIVAGGLPWLSLLRSATPPSEHRLAIAIVSVTTLVVVEMGLRLPSSYEMEEAFKRRIAEAEETLAPGQGDD